jgi:hypothetical protein
MTLRALSRHDRLSPHTGTWSTTFVKRLSAPPLRAPASIRVLALVSRDSSARLRIEQSIAIAVIRCSRSRTTRSPRHRLDRTIGPVPVGGGADALLDVWLPPSRGALRAARGLAAGILAPGLCPAVPAIPQPFRRILNIAALPRLRDYPWTGTRSGPTRAPLAL